MGKRNGKQVFFLLHQALVYACIHSNYLRWGLTSVQHYITFFIKLANGMQLEILSREICLPNSADNTIDSWVKILTPKLHISDGSILEKH